MVHMIVCLFVVVVVVIIIVVVVVVVIIVATTAAAAAAAGVEVGFTISTYSITIYDFIIYERFVLLGRSECKRVTHCTHSLSVHIFYTLE